MEKDQLVLAPGFFCVHVFSNSKHQMKSGTDAGINNTTSELQASPAFTWL